jgi:hypothetical protein
MKKSFEKKILKRICEHTPSGGYPEAYYSTAVSYNRNIFTTFAHMRGDDKATRH